MGESIKNWPEYEPQRLFEAELSNSDVYEFREIETSLYVELSQPHFVSEAESFVFVSVITHYDGGCGAVIQFKKGSPSRWEVHRSRILWVY